MHGINVICRLELKGKKQMRTVVRKRFVSAKKIRIANDGSLVD